MGLIDDIKGDVKKAGTNKGKFTYFREGVKQRVRFLTDMDDGMAITFHDSFERSINVPCQEQFGRDCPYCEDDGVRTRQQYAWSVYNYETKEVQIFMFPVNNCSPVPALLAMYENYGTLLDRDYVISVSGKQQNKVYSVVPMDKVKFRNDKAKAYSEKAVLKMLDKAYPCDASDDVDEDDDEPPRKRNKKADTKPVAKKSKKVSEPEDDDEDDYDEEMEDSDDEVDYSEMSERELYKLCKEHKIEAVPKKNKKYYIKLLEEYDAAQEDWGDDDDDDDDDEWEDDD